jgi:membrane glycosyltransferase
MLTIIIKVSVMKQAQQPFLKKKKKYCSQTVRLNKCYNLLVEMRQFVSSICRGVNVSTFRRHVSLGRNVKRNDFFVTLEQRNVEQRNMERKRNFLRSNVIFAKTSRFATIRSNET